MVDERPHEAGPPSERGPEGPAPSNQRGGTFRDYVKNVVSHQTAMQFAQSQLQMIQSTSMSQIKTFLEEIATDPWGAQGTSARQKVADYLAATNIIPGFSMGRAGWRPNPRGYSLEQAPKDPYSHHLTSAGSYFEPYEKLVTSFEDLNAHIVDLISNASSLQLLWRGQQDADWGVSSSLYRRLKEVNGVQEPGPGASGEQPYPTEEQMNRAELEILRHARTNWRLDGMPALETFARIQHAGGASRLIDVTKNPFIGAWFACEKSATLDDQDGRLFAFATMAPLEADADPPPFQVTLDHEWGTYTPRWHHLTTSEERRDFEWGSGSLRRLWVPPAFDSRIAAQNAAFLLDGVPLPAGEIRDHFRLPGRGPYWTRADILAAGSIYMKIADPAKKPRSNKFNLAPTFTFRIQAAAKKEIRDILTDRFGYTTSSIYPDVAKLAEHVNAMPLPTLEDSE